MIVAEFTFDLVPEGLFEHSDVPSELLGRMVVARELNHVVVPEAKGGVRVIGFHADAQNREVVLPAITLAERDEDHRRLSANAKGVGLYMGNSDAAMQHLTAEGRGRTTGVYQTPVLEPSEVRTFHSQHPMAPPRMAWGIARHLFLIGVSVVRDTEIAVDLTERKYGNASLVTMDPAPTWLWRQRGSAYPLKPTWSLWRDSRRRPLQRIGQLLTETR